MNFYFNFSCNYQMAAVQFNYSLIEQQVPQNWHDYFQTKYNEPQYTVVYEAVRSAAQEKEHKGHYELWRVVKRGMSMTFLKEASGPGVIEMNRRIK